MSEQVQNLPEIEIKVSGLPSRGVGYPKDATVKYRNYSWGEVRRASTSKVSILATLKNALSGVTSPLFDKQDLTLADALYIGILRKISTFSGMQIEVPYVCKKCKVPTKGVFSDRDLHFRDLPEEVTAFPLVVDLAGQELHFAPMTVKEYYNLNSGRYAKVLSGGKVDEVAVQASWIKNMDFEKAYKIINGLTAVEDFELITEIDRLLRHDIDWLRFKCPETDCGFDNSIRLEGREALLQPFRIGEKSNSGRIRFGKRTEPTSTESNESGIQSSDGLKS